MKIKFECDCKKRIKVSSKITGKQIKCPSCDRNIIVPSLSDSSVLEIECDCGQLFGPGIPECPKCEKKMKKDKKKTTSVFKATKRKKDTEKQTPSTPAVFNLNNSNYWKTEELSVYDDSSPILKQIDEKTIKKFKLIFFTCLIIISFLLGLISSNIKSISSQKLLEQRLKDFIKNKIDVAEVDNYKYAKDYKFGYPATFDREFKWKSKKLVTKPKDNPLKKPEDKLVKKTEKKINKKKEKKEILDILGNLIEETKEKAIPIKKVTDIKPKEKKVTEIKKIPVYKESKKNYLVDENYFRKEMQPLLTMHCSFPHCHGSSKNAKLYFLPEGTRANEHHNFLACIPYIEFKKPEKSLLLSKAVRNKVMHRGGRRFFKTDKEYSIFVNFINGKKSEYKKTDEDIPDLPEINTKKSNEKLVDNTERNKTKDDIPDLPEIKKEDKPLIKKNIAHKTGKNALGNKKVTKSSKKIKLIKPVSSSEKFYWYTAQPFLFRQCGTPQCHGGNLAGKFHLVKSSYKVDWRKNYINTLKYINYREPKKSLLYLKPLSIKEGGLPHTGEDTLRGKNVIFFIKKFIFGLRYSEKDIKKIKEIESLSKEKEKPKIKKKKYSAPTQHYFFEKIQPFMLKTCAKSNCHGGYKGGNFFLIRYPNSYYDQYKNFRAVLNFISKKEQERSLIILKPLKIKDGGIKHGGGEIIRKNSGEYKRFINFVQGKRK